MAFPAELLGTAVFLGLGDTLDDVDAKFGGTAFFMSIVQDGMRFPYLVTAHHVQDQLYKSNEKYVLARMNDGSGNARSFPLSGARWYRHPTDPGVDVAVCEPTLPEQTAPASIGRGLCIHPDHFTNGDFGVGDEVVTVGLFSFAHSKSAIVPIVRTGNLAMIPADRVAVGPPYFDMEAYLVEARSLGGLSGSPTYICQTMVTELTADPKTGGRRVSASRGSYGFLGLVHGHWDITENQLNHAFPQADPKGVNIGVAIVVPAHKILEVLDGEELRARRQEAVGRS